MTFSVRGHVHSLRFWEVWKMIIWEFFYSDTLWALMGAIKKWLGHTKRVPTTTSTGLISVIDKWNQEKFYFREKLTQKKIQSEKKSEKIRNFWRKITILEKCANFIIKKMHHFLASFLLVFYCTLVASLSSRATANQHQPIYSTNSSSLFHVRRGAPEIKFGFQIDAALWLA